MANVYKTVNEKILLTFAGSGKIANECCCEEEDCVPCCENPWKLCVTVSDGTITAKAQVSIVTTLTDCCCAGTATGNLCKTDGTNIGTVQVELLVTHDGVFARFTVTSATLATCAGGCVSAWVEGTLTGTVPTDCTITFTPTIARNGTTPLTVSATDSYISCNQCALDCPLTCNSCAATITAVVSGFTGCCAPLNGTVVMSRGGCSWVNPTGPLFVTLYCLTKRWRFTVLNGTACGNGAGDAGINLDGCPNVAGSPYVVNGQGKGCSGQTGSVTFS